MADPVSWTMIEPGWSVVTAEGDEVGVVHEVLGDSTADIFNGLAVSPGRFRSSRYVPAEQVDEIVEGRVRLSMSAEDFDRLDDAAPVPPSAEIRADTTDLTSE